MKHLVKSDQLQVQQEAHIMNFSINVHNLLLLSLNLQFYVVRKAHAQTQNIEYYTLRWDDYMHRFIPQQLDHIPTNVSGFTNHLLW